MMVHPIEEASQGRLLSLLQSQVHEQRQTLIQLRQELATARHALNQLEDQQHPEQQLMLPRKANNNLVLTSLHWQQVAESAMAALRSLTEQCEQAKLLGNNQGPAGTQTD